MNYILYLQSLRRVSRRKPIVALYGLLNTQVSLKSQIVRTILVLDNNKLKVTLSI